MREKTWEQPETSNFKPQTVESSDGGRALNPRSSRFERPCHHNAGVSAYAVQVVAQGAVRDDHFVLHTGGMQEPRVAGIEDDQPGMGTIDARNCRGDSD